MTKPTTVSQVADAFVAFPAPYTAAKASNLSYNGDYAYSYNRVVARLVTFARKQDALTSPVMLIDNTLRQYGTRTTSAHIQKLCSAFGHRHRYGAPTEADPCGIMWLDDIEHPTSERAVKGVIESIANSISVAADHDYRIQTRAKALDSACAMCKQLIFLFDVMPEVTWPFQPPKELAPTAAYYARLFNGLKPESSLCEVEPELPNYLRPLPAPDGYDSHIDDNGKHYSMSYKNTMLDRLLNTIAVAALEGA